MTGSTQSRELFMIGNAHLDPVWLWRWTEGYQEARATLKSAADLLEENRDYVFTLDQVVLLEWIRESDPHLFERIRTLVQAGRLEIVGGWWVEPDCNMPSGESFARQGLVAQRFLLEHFGVTATVGCNVDPFGHNVMLPQILSQQGMHSYMFLRPGPHENRLPSTAFWWESPDGSRVLAYRIAHEYCGPGGDVAYHVEKAVNQLSPDTGDAMVLYGVGNHGGGPTRENLASIAELNRRGTFGRMTLSAPGKYFDHLRAAGVHLPVWGGDLQMHAPGCYSANAQIKKLNRSSEQALLAAERYAVIAHHLVGTPYPATELLHAWKQLLFNQFHDILPGSAIEIAFQDAAQQHGEVRAIAARVTNRSLQTIARTVDIPAADRTQPILVFNPHPWPLETEVEVEVSIDGGESHIVDSDGHPVVSQQIRPLATLVQVVGGRSRPRLTFPVSIPPMGHRRYSLHPGLRAIEGETLRVTEIELENEFISLKIDTATGWLGSLFYKATGVDLLAGVTAPHTVITDDPSDTWGHRVISYVAAGAGFQPQRTRLTEDGPVRATVRIESEYGRSTLVEEFTVTAGDPAVRVAVHLDWREKSRLLKLRIPTALHSALATFEVPFGHLVRPADSTERPGQSWVDLTGTVGGTAAGLTVINDAKYAYDVTDSDVGITAARSPVYAWHDPKHLEPDGIYTYQDQGLQHFTYLLLPHTGSWRHAGVNRRAAELLMPAAVMFESFHPGSLPRQAEHISISDQRIHLTALKPAEDDATEVVVRAVETFGETGRADIRLPLLGRTIAATFGPYEIKTFKVSADSTIPITAVDLLEFELIDAAGQENDGRIAP